MFHIYRQQTRSDAFRDVALEAEPTALSRKVGREVDIIVGWALASVELQLTLGAFFPGNAFEPDTHPAWFAEYRLSIEF